MATTKSLEIKNVSNKQSKSSSKKNTLSKIKEIAYTTVIYAELILMCLIVLFPVVWIVGSSFNQGTSLAAATPIQVIQRLCITLNYLSKQTLLSGI